MIPISFGQFIKMVNEALTVTAQTPAGYVNVTKAHAIQWAESYTMPEIGKDCATFFNSQWGIVIGGDSHVIVRRDK